jgi:hypothetical protein
MWNHPGRRLVCLLLLFLGVLPVSQTMAAPLPAIPGSIRTIHYPAKALSFDPTTDLITQFDYGLVWQSSDDEIASLLVAKPADWDGTSEVTFHLDFVTEHAASGTVVFRISAQALDIGDLPDDGFDLSGTPVPVSGAGQVHRQSFTIPAVVLGDNPLWVVVIQREGPPPAGRETYPGAVTLMSVELSYTGGAQSAANTSVPANALGYSGSDPGITQGRTGVRWARDESSGGWAILPKPADWDGTSPVQLRLFFYPLTDASGTIDFFIRPQAFNPGDPWSDGNAITTIPLTSNAKYRISAQTFLIPAAEFGEKDLWSIAIQRSATGTTYLGDVVVVALDLTYNRKVNFLTEQALTGNALNYAKTSPILTQVSHGLGWQADGRDAGYLILPRPPGWNGSRELHVKLYFLTTAAGDGEVEFFIRPRSYNPGDLFGDAISYRGPRIHVSQASQVQVQDIPFPASRFGDKDLWVLSIQRSGPAPLGAETYLQEVVLLAVKIDYTNRLFLPSIVKTP